MFSPLSSLLTRSLASLAWGRAAGGHGGRRGVSVAGHGARRSSCFSVVPCSCCDEDRVIDFLRRTFYRDEPVLVAAGLSECPPEELLDHSRVSFREGLSLMAVRPDQDQGIVGVAINSIVGPTDACKLRQQAAAASCPNTRRVLELWCLMLERPEIWRDLEPQGGCMLELRELATDQAVRGQGVGLQLALATREVAANAGAPFLKIDCTSQYSAKIAEKLGMKKVFAVQYADYVDSDGKPLFQPPCPHDEAAVYVQRLPKDCQQQFGGEW